MNETLWRILEAISGVAIVPLMGFLTTLLIQKIKLQSQKIKGSKEEEIKLTVALAVSASEQLYKAGKINDRKEHAISTVKKILGKKKLNIDDDLLSELIEAEVWNSMNSSLPATTTTSSSTTTTTSSPLTTTSLKTNSSSTVTTTSSPMEITDEGRKSADGDGII